MTIGIVIFAMVAAFLGMRLYAVLGKRTGHEQPLGRTGDELARTPAQGATVEDGHDAPAAIVDGPQSSSAESGLRAITLADRSFNPAEFIEGAKSAYRMILEAFWAGNEDAYAAYVSDDVKSAFASAVTERAAQGHVLDNRLITVERAVITEATLENGVATVMVKFDADIAAVTRDKDGAVVAGSLTDAVTTHDAWTFARTLRSSDPNWQLVDTDEAA